MELFLNLVWLALALISISVWWTWGLPAFRGRARLLSPIALCCFLFLMFYVISMTDDLHDEIVFAEEATSARNAVHAAKLAASGCDSLNHSAPVVAINEVAPAEAAVPHVIGRVSALPLRSLPDSDRTSKPPRAPPQYL